MCCENAELMITRSFVLLTIFLLLNGCSPREQPGLLVSVLADGRERRWQYPEPITVEQFLREVEFQYDPTRDRINPQPWTQIFDGIKITIVRVTENTYCTTESIPFETIKRLTEALHTGEEQVGQLGRNGTQEICYRVTLEDGIQTESVEISRTTISVPQPEIIFVAPANQLDPVLVIGTLAYLSNNNAWMIRGNSSSKRLLTTTFDLDPRVFSLSPDGQRLLVARKSESESAFGNQLWLITNPTSESPNLIPLTPQDVLYAEWIPGIEDTVSYSTGEPKLAAPGWSALNDLWVMRIDPETGDQIDIQEVLGRSSGGLYGWWGTQYKWSPNGSQVVWINADKIGLVDLEDRDFGVPLLSYAAVATGADWSWRATVSWSVDGSLLLTTTHGLPYGGEQAEYSPIFNVVAVATDGSFSAEIAQKTGMWSSPQYSPDVANSESVFPKGYMAYLQAREWENSRNGEYDLVIADRDGSNARIVFPDSQQPGLRAQAGELAWSPDGRQLAFIYLGNLWIIDVETAIAHQLTQDGQASKPVWTQ